MKNLFDATVANQVTIGWGKFATAKREALGEDDGGADAGTRVYEESASFLREDDAGGVGDFNVQTS